MGTSESISKMAAPMELVEVRQSLPNKGRGLFAVQDIAKGDILFEENPLVCCQFLWNTIYNYVACDFCMRSLETAEAMSQRLTANPTLILPYPKNCGVRPEEHTRCPQCQVLYCSAQCRDEAWNQYHRTMCLDTFPAHDHPLIRLQEFWRTTHYPPETASVMLVARMVATVRQAVHKEAAVAAFSNFCRATVNEQEEIAHKLLGEQFVSQLEVMRNLLGEALYEEDLAPWFTTDGFRSVFALIGTNGQGIGTSSLSIWCHACDAMDLKEDERTTLDEFIDQLYVDIEKESGNFLNCEGSGLYALQSTCNHSCEPNTEVTFPHNNCRLALQALEDIKAGDEIYISYLDECQRERTRHSRQKALQENYLFTCTCQKCISQADEPDVTSDEEDDDDMED